LARDVPAGEGGRISGRRSAGLYIWTRYHQPVALIFKRLASDVGKSGAFMSYLKYALGEIVLVVVGILIALQINDWYQERLDRQTERE
jgi:hypothetical protein